MTLIKPDEGVMIGRDLEGFEGFDRSAIRQEFAPVQAIDPGTRFVEEGDATFLRAHSDMPGVPTGLGESFGNVDLVTVTGGTQPLQRWTHGFSIDVEDREVDTSFIRESRDAILELFDLKADYVFLQGLDREDGTTITKGLFQWLEDNMDSANILNAADYDPSAGDLQGIPANIVKQKAYELISGAYVTDTDPRWDIAVAKHPVWAYWNQMGTFDGATIQSQWELMQADADSASVGVGRRMLLPDSLSLPTAPGDDDIDLAVDFPARTNSSYTSPLSDASDDVMYLIPDHGGDFYELYEQGSPDTRVIEVEGWKERVEYKWRAGVVQGQNRHRGDTTVAKDVVKIENVTALFDNA